MSIQHLFLSRELSQIAKQKGYNEPCLAAWFEYNTGWQLLTPKDSIYGENYMFYNSEDIFKDNNVHGAQFTAPLYQQIIDWFREKHQLDIWSNPYDNFDEPFDIVYCYHIIQRDWGSDKECHILSVHQKFETYYDALNAAIEEAFKLIS